jgi:hypothetical protein
MGYDMFAAKMAIADMLLHMEIEKTQAFYKKTRDFLDKYKKTRDLMAQRPKKGPREISVL